MTSEMEPLAPSLSLPDQRNYDQSYGLALKIAFETLATIDIESQCQRAGAAYRVGDSQKVITLDYLNRQFEIIPPDQVREKGSPEEVPLRDKILIMHYFLQAKGTPLTSKPINFKELKEGASYFPTFSKRAILPLVDYFGKESPRLLEVAKQLGGEKADYGDAAVTIKAFPRVPITLVVWRGDEEFPPEANILFDSTISDYLPTEDIIVLCQTISWKLVSLLPQEGA
ncbi:MAG: DUF3786 domain-containing protein [Chloroflexi bacterium]|nr:DUF3786 domain-containing protein [Chloroflexota bacterium]